MKREHRLPQLVKISERATFEGFLVAEEWVLCRHPNAAEPEMVKCLTLRGVTTDMFVPVTTQLANAWDLLSLLSLAWVSITFVERVKLKSGRDFWRVNVSVGGPPHGLMGSLRRRGLRVVRR